MFGFRVYCGLGLGCCLDRRQPRLDAGLKRASGCHQRPTCRVMGRFKASLHLPAMAWHNPSGCCLISFMKAISEPLVSLKAGLLRFLARGTRLKMEGVVPLK